MEQAARAICGRLPRKIAARLWRSAASSVNGRATIISERWSKNAIFAAFCLTRSHAAYKLANSKKGNLVLIFVGTSQILLVVRRTAGGG